MIRLCQILHRDSLFKYFHSQLRVKNAHLLIFNTSFRCVPEKVITAWKRCKLLQQRCSYKVKWWINESQIHKNANSLSNWHSWFQTISSTEKFRQAFTEIEMQTSSLPSHEKFLFPERKIANPIVDKNNRNCFLGELTISRMSVRFLMGKKKSPFEVRENWSLRRVRFVFLHARQKCQPKGWLMARANCKWEKTRVMEGPDKRKRRKRSLSSTSYRARFSPSGTIAGFVGSAFNMQTVSRTNEYARRWCTELLGFCIFIALAGIFCVFRRIASVDFPGWFCFVPRTEFFFSSVGSRFKRKTMD